MTITNHPNIATSSLKFSKFEGPIIPVDVIGVLGQTSSLSSYLLLSNRDFFEKIDCTFKFEEDGMTFSLATSSEEAIKKKASLLNNVILKDTFSSLNNQKTYSKMSFIAFPLNADAEMISKEIQKDFETVSRLKSHLFQTIKNTKKSTNHDVEVSSLCEPVSTFITTSDDFKDIYTEKFEQIYQKMDDIVRAKDFAVISTFIDALNNNAITIHDVLHFTLLDFYRFEIDFEEKAVSFYSCTASATDLILPNLKPWENGYTETLIESFSFNSLKKEIASSFYGSMAELDYEGINLLDAEQLNKVFSSEENLTALNEKLHNISFHFFSEFFKLALLPYLSVIISLDLLEHHVVKKRVIVPPKNNNKKKNQKKTPTKYNTITFEHYSIDVSKIKNHLSFLSDEEIELLPFL